MKKSNMVIFQLVIYIIAVNGLGFDGEGNVMPSKDKITSIRTKTQSIKSVIKNSLLKSTSNNGHEFTVTNLKETHHTRSTTAIPYDIDTQLASTKSNNNELNKHSTLTSFRKRTDAYRKLYTDEISPKMAIQTTSSSPSPTKATKNQIISENNGINSTKMLSLAFDAVRTVDSGVDRLKRQHTDHLYHQKPQQPQQQHQQQKQSFQRKKLANEQRILLTGNPHNEELDDDISWSKMLANTTNANVFRSVSNSIIATVIPPAVLSLSFSKHKAVEEPLIDHSAVDAMEMSETIGPYRSASNEKTIPIYVTRAPDENEHNKSSSTSLLAMPLSTMTNFDDKHRNVTVSVAKSSNATTTPLSVTNGVFNFIDVSSVNEINNTKIDELLPMQQENLMKTKKLTATVVNNETKETTETKVTTTSEAVTHSSSTWHNQNFIKIDNESDSMKRNPHEMPYNLNQSKLNVKTTTQQPNEMSSDDSDNSQIAIAKTNEKTELVECEKSSTENRQINDDENDNLNEKENVVDIIVVNECIEQKLNESNVVHKQIFHTSMAQTTTVNATKPFSTSNNVSSYLNSLHIVANLTQTNTFHFVHDQIKRNDIELNMHNDSSGSDAKMPFAKVLSINSTNDSMLSRLHFDRKNGMSKNSTTNINNNINRINNLSQPSEIISLSTSSKLTSSSLLVDEVNNTNHNSLNTRLSTPSNGTTDNTSHEIQQQQQQIIRSSYDDDNETTTNIDTIHSSSTFVPFEYVTQHIDSDYNDFDSKITPAVNVMRISKNVASPIHYLAGNDVAAVDFNAEKYMNNFLNAAITAEHGELDTQFPTGYSNGSKHLSDRFDQFLHTFYHFSSEHCWFFSCI